MAQKLTLSWQDIEADCKALAQKIPHSVDVIVAITKGGLPPATIIANKYLSRPHIVTLQLEEIAIEGQPGYQSKKVKIVSPLNIYPIENKKVLILDDVADSGPTLKKALTLVKTHQPQMITTAALHYKPRSRVKPDIFARQIDNDVWIVYPWE